MCADREDMDEANTLQALLRTATIQLGAAGVPSARVDAQLLVAHVMGVSRSELQRLAVLGDTYLNASQQTQLAELVRQRYQRVPLQHLTGVAPFRRLQLRVGPGVFVPRPETELLAGWGIERLELAASRLATHVVDLCAGSGAIALALATEFPGAQVSAVEREPEALVWLRRNVADRRPSAGSRIEVVAGDATAPDTLAELDGAVDLVLSNPPYLALDEEVTEEGLLDPPSALWADDTGLSVISAVAVRAATLLRSDGWFGVEHGETQGDRVRALLHPDTWRHVETHLDLAERDRFTTAQRL